MNPSYHSLGDHTETVDLDYDPDVTSYDNLLTVFWKNHDPAAKRTRQYMSVIFYHDPYQKESAERTKDEVQRQLAKSLHTLVLPAGDFYEAEAYHQKYLLQEHPFVLTSLGMDPDDLIRSHVAARLNGYIGGYGEPSDFDSEWEKLGINEKVANYVRNCLVQARRG